jgi:hypothetical protein
MTSTKAISELAYQYEISIGLAQQISLVAQCAGASADYDGEDLSFPSIDDAVRALATLETCGIDGDWGIILDSDWSSKLGLFLNSEWESLSADIKKDLEAEAVGIAKDTQLGFLIKEINEWIEENRESKEED